MTGEGASSMDCFLPPMTDKFGSKAAIEYGAQCEALWNRYHNGKLN